MRRAPFIAVPVLLIAVGACGNGTATTEGSASRSASTGAPSGETAPRRPVPAPSAQRSAAPSPSTANSAGAPDDDSWDPTTPGSPLSFGDTVKVPGLADPKSCAVDGPMWPSGSSGAYGGPCTKEAPEPCFEMAQALYEYGRWTCARAYHAKACELAPHMTDPPPGATDYPLVGFPRCPIDKDLDGRVAWKDKELKDPVKKSCFLDHVATACTKLAGDEKNETEQRKLLQLAAAFRAR